MREIKFRAWDKNSEYMHSNVQSGVYEDPDEWTDFDVVLGLERFEVMQYTGLKDKNGNEIYEGDVVDYLGDIELVNRNVLRVIEYKNEEACYVARLPVGVDGEEAVYLNEHDFKVIGNIYENPELLEETA